MPIANAENWPKATHIACCEFDGLSISIVREYFKLQISESWVTKQLLLELLITDS